MGRVWRKQTQFTSPLSDHFPIRLKSRYRQIIKKNIRLLTPDSTSRLRS
jgi:hypothetical protein